MHDVFICCDEKDEWAGEAVYHLFEKNNISCWIQSRHFSDSVHVGKISDAIKDSKAVVLVYSKNSQKNNYVISEIDLAFTSKIPILVFNIDYSDLKGDMEFFIKNKPLISAYPTPETQLESLVKKTADLMGKEINEVTLPKNDIKLFEKNEPVSTGDKLKKFIAVAVPLVVILILVYFFVIVPTGQHTTEDGGVSMKITDVSVAEDNGKFLYTVYGESYNLPSDSKNYIIKTNYYDKNNNNVYSLNATADEFSLGVICSFDVAKDNITNVTLELVDLNNNVISKDNYLIS